MRQVTYECAKSFQPCRAHPEVPSCTLGTSLMDESDHAMSHMRHVALTYKGPRAH